MSSIVKSKVEVPELIEKRRREIVRAAIGLFGKRGYHVTTIRDVADRAKVSVGLIYQYVQDKEDVLFLALIEVLDSYRRRIPADLKDLRDPMERFCTAVRAYCDVIDQNVDATVLAYRETKSLRRERRNLIKQKETETNALIGACVEDCIAAGLFDPVDVEFFTYEIVMFCHAWALKAWRFAGSMPVDGYVQRGLDLMLHGLLTARGRREYDRLTASGRSRPAATAKGAGAAGAPRRTRRLVPASGE